MAALAFKVVNSEANFQKFLQNRDDFDCDNCLEHTNEAETQQTYLS